MRLHILFCEVVGIIRRHQLDVEFLSDLDDFRINNSVFRRPMILDF